MKYLAAFVVAGLGLLISAPSAFAEPENESLKTVTIVAVNAENAAFQLADRGPSGACFLGLISFDPNTTTGRLWYAGLLDAMARGSQVDVAYERSAAACQATQIAFHP